MQQNIPKVWNSICNPGLGDTQIYGAPKIWQSKKTFSCSLKMGLKFISSTKREKTGWLYNYLLILYNSSDWKGLQFKLLLNNFNFQLALVAWSVRESITINEIGQVWAPSLGGRSLHHQSSTWSLEWRKVRWSKENSC